MTDRIAVDIVLLPPPEIADMAVEANRRLADPAGGIALNSTDCLPHISLAMGCIETGRIDQVREVLRSIAAETGELKLAIIGVAMVTGASGIVISSLIVGKTKQLQILHERVMERLENHLDSAASAEMFAGPRPIAQSSVEWVGTFREKSAFENFVPHITIGLGRTRPLDAPVEFIPPALALCRLGNHCTCRKVLAEVPLAPGP